MLHFHTDVKNSNCMSYIKIHVSGNCFLKTPILEIGNGRGRSTQYTNGLVSVHIKSFDIPRETLWRQKQLSVQQTNRRNKPTNKRHISLNN